MRKKDCPFALTWELAQRQAAINADQTMNDKDVSRSTLFSLISYAVFGQQRFSVFEYATGISSKPLRVFTISNIIGMRVEATAVANLD